MEFLSSFTPVAYASVDSFVFKLNKLIFNPLIALMIAIAFAMFIYGVFEYISNSGKEEGRTKGQRHIMWGLIGLFIMVGVFFIMKLLLGTLGIDESQINVESGLVNPQ